MNILIAILIAVSVTALTAWWNIQIRFAANKEAATRLWKRVAYWGFIIFFLGVQIWNFVVLQQSNEPLTRRSVASMIMSETGVLLTLASVLLTLANVFGTKNLDFLLDQIKTLAEAHNSLHEKVAFLEQKLLSPASPSRTVDKP